MKRTLTAATALVVSSAGAVGFAGTAAAITSPESAGNPAAHGAEDGLAGAARDGLQTVGDVVPAPQSEQASTPKAMLPAAGGDQLGRVGSVLDPQGPLIGELGKQLAGPQGQLIKSSGSSVAGIPLDGALGGQQAPTQPRDAAQPRDAGTPDVNQGLLGQHGPVAGVVGDVQNLDKPELPTGKSGNAPEAGNGEAGKGTGLDSGTGSLNRTLQGVLGPSVDLGTPLG